MLPAFKPGDRVLTFNWAKPKVGDVIIFFGGGRYYLKRIRGFDSGLIAVVGDNPKSSNMGPIKRNQIIGRVILKF